MDLTICIRKESGFAPGKKFPQCIKPEKTPVVLRRVENESQCTERKRKPDISLHEEELT
jgi:hypothetical protein